MSKDEKIAFVTWAKGRDIVADDEVYSFVYMEAMYQVVGWVKSKGSMMIKRIDTTKEWTVA